MKASYFTIALLLLVGVCRADEATTSFQARVQPLLRTYCTKCHGAEKQKKKINFEAARSGEQLAAERDLWFRMADQIESSNM